MDNTLEKINKEILNCQKCLLCKTRIHPVPGEGSSHARIMFIGEAPGKMRRKQVNLLWCLGEGVGWIVRINWFEKRERLYY